MKNGWTTHSSNNAIWLDLSPCHMTMTCKINKLEKPGRQLRIFHTLFGRSAAFYGHFRADTVTSEWSICISSAVLLHIINFFRKATFWKRLIIRKKAKLSITYFFWRVAFLEQPLFQKMLPCIAFTFWKKLVFYKILFQKS